MRNDDYGYGYGSCCGILTAILIIGAALLAAIGAILGAVFAGFVTENLVVFAAFAVVMLLIFVLLLIVRACRDCSCR
ncbi:MAG: hypothetical protein IJ426_03925 [Clostridia bacterium]|nr:hypothetical protein [Clostridia bacterium]